MRKFIGILGFIFLSCWSKIFVEVGMWMIIILGYLLIQPTLELRQDEVVVLSPYAFFYALGILVSTVMTTIGLADGSKDLVSSALRPVVGLLAVSMAFFSYKIIFFEKYQGFAVVFTLVFTVLITVICLLLFIGSVIEAIVGARHLLSEWHEQRDREWNSKLVAENIQRPQ